MMSKVRQDALFLPVLNRVVSGVLKELASEINNGAYASEKEMRDAFRKKLVKAADERKRDIAGLRDQHGFINAAYNIAGVPAIGFMK